MHHRAKIVILLFLCLFLSFNVVQVAHAKDETIKISVDEGFNGKIKSGKGFPMSIKLENIGESFSGDLLINFLPSWNTGGAIALNVELPANSTKTYQISLPGLSEDNPYTHRNEPMIHLYKDGMKKGEKVDFTGENKIKPKYIDMNEMVIGVLSENYDRLKELRILPSTSIQMIELKKEQIPNRALGLEMLDYLIIDEYAISQLDKEQQEAIIDWIEAGGILIAGAAPDGSQSYGLLYSLLPMKIENETSAGIDFLQVKPNEEPTFKQLQFFTGTLDKMATVIEKSGALPATVKKHYGNGTILQTSFSLGDEPISSWKGYSDWFAIFIKNANSKSLQTGKYGPDFYGSLYWEFVEANEYFPASNFSIGQLIGMLVGYLVIIVPILYFTLKKLDKREHAWWIIPSLAFVSASIVFGIGAKDRIAMPQLNQMGIYKAKDNQLTGIQVSTLLSNKSGEYTLSFPKTEFNAIASTQSSGGTSPLDPLRGAIFEEKREKMDIVFPDVGYWSSKTIYGQASKKVTGKFTSNLVVKNGVITGTIENGFDYDFQEVFIWTGNEKIKLGPLKKGEQVKVEKQIKQSFLTKPTATGYQGYPNNQQDLNKMKIEKLEYAAGNYLISRDGSINEPVIAGIMKEPVIDVKITGKKVKRDNFNLIIEPFTAKNEFSGSFIIRNEQLGTNLNVINGRIYDNQNMVIHREIMIENGEYDYTLQLPKQISEKSFKVNELSFTFNNNNFVKYSLYNKETGEELPINSNSNQRSFKIGNEDNVNQYVTKDGKILLKLLKEANGDQYVQLPSITIKGEVTP